MFKRIRHFTHTLARTLTFALTLILPLTLHASPQSKLNSINQNIVSIQNDLQKAVTQKSQLQNMLAQTETREGKINQALWQTQKTLLMQHQQLAILKEKSVALEQIKEKNRQLLRQQISAAYVLYQEPYLKLLLAPNDVTKTQQLLMYFHYITKAQLQLVKQLQESIASYQNNQTLIAQQYAKLTSLKQSQTQDQKTLQNTLATRQTLMQHINQHIQTKQQKLASLVQDKTALENTLLQLTQQVNQPAVHASSESSSIHFHPINMKKPFAQMQGALSWPVRGNIEHAFGAPIDQSELKWDGAVIDAPAGEAVHAVAPGRVIFAKWMAGYGLLLIINHGNGYMSLYGRNESLMKKVGDVVHANEIIATIGKSGGFRHDALYFSIRHNAQALNPAMWCR